MGLASIGSRRWREPLPPYGPGQRIPFSGIYVVQHYSHRNDHEVIVVQGAFFPVCRVCGHQVRFVPLRTADRLREDYDFDYRLTRAAAG